MVRHDGRRVSRDTRLGVSGTRLVGDVIVCTFQCAGVLNWGNKKENLVYEVCFCRYFEEHWKEERKSERGRLDGSTTGSPSREFLLRLVQWRHLRVTEGTVDLPPVRGTEPCVPSLFWTKNRCRDRNRGREGRRSDRQKSSSFDSSKGTRKWEDSETISIRKTDCIGMGEETNHLGLS